MAETLKATGRLMNRSNTRACSSTYLNVHVQAGQTVSAKSLCGGDVAILRRSIHKGNRDDQFPLIGYFGIGWALAIHQEVT